MADPTTDRLARIDDRIADLRQLELRAVWANHPDESSYWAFEIARLQNLRVLIERGVFPPTVVHVDLP